MERADLPLLIESFARNGFVHVKGLLPRNEVEAYGRAVDHAVASRKVHDTRKLEEKSLYEQSFIQCQNLWEDFAAVRKLSFDQRITSTAAALIGTEKLRLWHDQALYKEPGGRDTDAHQDHPYWPIAGDKTLTAWIPLMDIDDATGCMGYVPGSHFGERSYVNIFTEPGSGKKLLERLAPVEPVFVPCRAGDVIYHHGSTAHLAKPNRSNGMRRVHTVIYLADGLTRSDTPPHHPAVDRAKIPIGGLIASDVTPIAWPLPDGVLPKPVPWPDSKRVQDLKRLGIVPGDAH